MMASRSLRWIYQAGTALRAWLRGFAERHIVRDTTPSEDACENCRVVDCDDRQAAECQPRGTVKR